MLSELQRLPPIYLASGFNESCAGAHVALIAEGMTVALVGAVVVIAGDQVDHCLQPGHVLGRLIILVGIRGRFRLLIVAKYTG